MSLVDRAFKLLDEFQFRVMQRRVNLTQPATRQVTTFREPKPERKIPMYGGEPGAFGEDYIFYKKPETRYVQNLPVEWQNIHGYVSPNAERPMQPEEPYQDPAISSRGARTSEDTDQRPIGPHDLAPLDKPITLSVQQKHDFQGSRARSEELTEGDKAAADLRKWDFDFSS